MTTRRKFKKNKVSISSLRKSPSRRNHKVRVLKIYTRSLPNYAEQHRRDRNLEAQSVKKKDRIKFESNKVKRKEKKSVSGRVRE